MEEGTSAVTHVDGAFVIEDGGKRLAETTYTLANNVMTMPHTWVDDSLRGHGVASKLVDTAVAYAREHHYKILPVCSFVKAEFDKDPSIQDVRAA
ncbi:MAG: N-acetyltransferase [Myxococcota bacterium]|nr:N-acetyltransferase [Deltaproteobacteria bacterium]MDQ3336869.1 N-acetyltransferase [Myxococcota bacterium]